MDEAPPAPDQSASLSEWTSWESWVNSFFVWVPYVTLGASVVLAQVGNQSTTDRLMIVALTLVAAAWTWLAFTRLGPPTQVAQWPLRLYFVGFLILAAVLVLREPVFLVYGITGFFHGALLRPWPLAFVGIGATGLVIHSHIVATESTPATWAIYLGVVAVQTLAVGFGLYAGEKITEIAEERRETLGELELAMAENAGLHDQLVAQAREAGMLDERQRMAREIHDTIAQGLTGVITQIEAVNQSWSNEEEMHRHLDTASELARESLTEARRSVQALRPAPLEDSRLPVALGDVTARWSEVTGLPVQFTTVGERHPLRPEVEVTLLRAAQEGLTNVAKHAAATRAGVTLTFMDDAVSLDVRDDGTGFDPDQAERDESFGLAAMQQRVAELDGEMLVESAPGDGTAISIQIPTVVAGASHGR